MISVYRNQRIDEQVEAVQTGGITATDLAAAVRNDIDRYEPRLQAWVTFVQDEARNVQCADLSSSPLAGVSVGVKDNIDVAGLPTRVGSSVTSAEPAAQDAHIVSRLKALGAIVQGKTVTTEFSYFSPGPTVNPWAHDHTPGGSSSGSAAAIGANTIPIALGTQTAGSLTRPASFCGAAGMVLAVDPDAMEGVAGLSETLDALGIMTRSVADLDWVHAALTGRTPGDDSVADNTSLHVWDGSDLLPIAAEMQVLLQEIPRLAAEIDADVTNLDWTDHVITLTDDHHVVMGYEAARSMAPIVVEHEAALSTQLRTLLKNGKEIPEQSYREALIRRDISYRALERLLGSDGIIIGPAAQGPPNPFSDGTGSPDLSRPWQLLGLPVVIVPGARTTSGLRLGLQLIGLPGSESKLLAVGRRLEALLRRLPSFAEHMTQPTLKDLTW